MAPTSSQFNILVPDSGTAAAPTLGFLNSSLTGFFLKSDSTIGVSCGGVEVFNFSTSGGSDVGSLILADGTAAAPSLAFGGASGNTGLYLAAADSLGFSANGTTSGNYSSAGNWTFVGAAVHQNKVSLGTTAVTANAIGVIGDATQTLMSGTSQAGMLSNFASTSAATSTTAAYRVGGSFGTQAAAFTASTVCGMYSPGFTKGAGSTITRAINFLADAQSVGTNNVTLSDNQTFTGNYFFHQSGTEASVLSGALTIAPTTNQLVLGVTRTATISAAQPATSSRVYTIPDQGANANFLMSAAAQTVAGQQTFSAAPIMSAGITAVSTNSDASTGIVGEVLVASRLKSAATGATSTTSLNVTSAALPLTAGDWDVSGAIGYIPAGTTSITILTAAISKTTATLPASDTMAVPTSGEVKAQWATAANVSGANDITIQLPTTRISLAGTTNIFLVANATFSVSTLAVYGSINARRVR